MDSLHHISSPNSQLHYANFNLIWPDRAFYGAGIQTTQQIMLVLCVISHCLEWRETCHMGRKKKKDWFTHTFTKWSNYCTFSRSWDYRPYILHLGALSLSVTAAVTTNINQPTHEKKEQEMMQRSTWHLALQPNNGVQTGWTPRPCLNSLSSLFFLQINVKRTMPPFLAPLPSHLSLDGSRCVHEWCCYSRLLTHRGGHLLQLKLRLHKRFHWKCGFFSSFVRENFDV